MQNRRPKDRTQLAFWGIVLAAALMLVGGASGIPLVDPDEARFARTSVEMLRAGDWVLPTFEGQPRLAKPPLLHWIQIPIFKLAGAYPLTARLHSIGSLLALMILTAALLRRRLGNEAAPWAAGLLFATPLTFMLGQLGTIDMLLALHVFAIVALDLVQGSATENTHFAGRSWLVGALAGLAFLAKGPVGPLLALVAVVCGRASIGRSLRPTFKEALKCIAGFVLTVSVWVPAFLTRIGWGSSGSTLKSELFDRVAGGTVHVEPFHYYVWIWLVALLPWGLLIALAMLRALAPAGRGRPLARYATAAAIGGTVVLSFSAGKLPSYLLPLIPLGVVLLVSQLGEQLKRPVSLRWVGWVLVLSQSIAATGLISFALRADAESQRRVAWIGGLAFVLAAIGGALANRSGQVRKLYAAALAASWIFLAAASIYLLPDVAASRTSANLVQAAQERGWLAPSETVVVVEMKLPSLVFYLDRVPEYTELLDLEERIESPDRPWFVFDRQDFDPLSKALQSKLEIELVEGKFMLAREPLR